MENEELRQYLIDFVEKTLNECEAFTRVYGKDFVRKRLEKNATLLISVAFYINDLLFA